MRAKLGGALLCILIVCADAFHVLFSGDGTHIRSAYPIARELLNRGHRVSFCVRDYDFVDIALTFDHRAVNWCAGRNDKPIKAHEPHLVRATTPRDNAPHYLWPITVELAQWILFSRKSDWWYDGLTAARAKLVGDDRPDVVVADFASFSVIDFAEELGARVVVYDTMVAPAYITSVRTEPAARCGMPFAGPAGAIDAVANHAVQWAAPLLRLPATLYMNHKRWERGLPLVANLEDYWLRWPVIAAMTAEGVAEPAALPASVTYVGYVTDSVATRVADHDEQLTTYLDTHLANNVPVVYVAMGTRVHLSQEMVLVFAAALRSSEWAVVWVLQRSYTDWVPEEIAQDDLFYLCNHAPQAVALNHSAVRVHVTHGGAHSLAESYVGGVPVVVIPQFADQPHNAALAQYRGAGVSVSPKGLTPHGLRQAIRDVLYAPRYAAAAARLGAILRGAGGAGRAATVVEDALHGRLDGAIPLEYSMPWLERYHLDAYCIYLVIAGAAYWLIKRMEAKYFPNPTPTQAAPKRPKAQKAD